MIECLKDPFFYKVQKPNSCFGIANIYGEEILDASNRLMDIYVIRSNYINLIATTEDDIYILCCGGSSLQKRSFSYRCTSLGIKIRDVLKIEIGDAYKYDHDRELKTQFFYIGIVV